MTQIENKQIGHVYNDLANKYGARKKESMINILHCGQILNNAKKTLPHGMFSNFLADTRVAESERTAQRLMAIFRNFGHILADPDKKISALERLGVSHLLELQKLPKRFRKEVEMETEVEGDVVKEKVEVIDEEKLSDFLDKNVDYKGEKKHIRDLPLDEMKSYINQASGIYEPSKEEHDKHMSESTENKELSESSSLPNIKGAEEVAEFDSLESKDDVKSMTDETHLKRLRSKMSQFTEYTNDLFNEMRSFSERDDLDQIPGDIKTDTIKESKIVQNKVESILMQIMNLEEKLS